MWMAFGLVAFTVSVIGALVLRSEGSWKGTVVPGSHEWHVAGTETSPRAVTVRIAVPAPAKLDFCLHPERERDRIAKKLRISVEQEVGHDDFDRNIYMQTDDPRIRRLLAGNEGLRQTVLDLFSDTHGFSLSGMPSLRATGGRLILAVRCPAKESTVIRIAMGRLQAPRLREIARALRGLPERKPSTRDFLGLRALVILALSSGILITGILEAMAQLALDTSRVIEKWQWLMLAIPGGILLTLLLVLLTFRWLGHTSRTHIVLAEVLTLGLLGACLLSAANIQRYNSELDPAPAEIVDAVVEDKHSIRIRRGRSYWIEFRSADLDVHGAQVRIGADLYRHTHVGDHWRLVKHPGAFHIAWLESWGPAPAEPAPE